VAEALSTTQSHVRQLVARGDLESFTIGKRSVRIYWDSVADYQDRNTRPGPVKTESLKPRAKPSAASTAAARAAYATLQAAGILKKRRPVGK